MHSSNRSRSASLHRFLSVGQVAHDSVNFNEEDEELAMQDENYSKNDEDFIKNCNNNNSLNKTRSFSLSQSHIDDPMPMCTSTPINLGKSTPSTIIPCRRPSLNNTFRRFLQPKMGSHSHKICRYLDSPECSRVVLKNNNNHNNKQPELSHSPVITITKAKDNSEQNVGAGKKIELKSQRKDGDLFQRLNCAGSTSRDKDNDTDSVMEFMSVSNQPDPTVITSAAISEENLIFSRRSDRDFVDNPTTLSTRQTDTRPAFLNRLTLGQSRNDLFIPTTPISSRKSLPRGNFIITKSQTTDAITGSSSMDRRHSSSVATVGRTYYDFPKTNFHLFGYRGRKSLGEIATATTTPRRHFINDNDDESIHGRRRSYHHSQFDISNAENDTNYKGRDEGGGGNNYGDGSFGTTISHPGTPNLGKARTPGNFMRRSATIAFSKGRKLSGLLGYSLPRRKTNMNMEALSSHRSSFDSAAASSVASRRESAEKVLGASHDLFELLERLQNSRLDDQRCVLPSYFTQSSREDGSKSPGASNMTSSSGSASSSSTSPPPSKELLEEVLSRPGPYPMVVLPRRGGYWVEGAGSESPPEFSSLSNCNNTGTMPKPKIDQDETALAYRKYFFGKDHYNFCATDEKLGPILLSVKAETVAGHEHWRLILRLKTGTSHELVPVSCLSNNHLTTSGTSGINSPCPARMAKLLNEDVTTDKFTPVVCPRASDLIVAYDEHVLVNTYKFGVVLQKQGQSTEEELFSNRSSESLDEFLHVLGDRIQLTGHEGYRGGLDTLHGQTGDESVFHVFQNREIMFHVSHLLPFMESDPQQLQRKRHIGNDIVAVIFQEENTPFSPDMIASHFLHAFIVVEVIDPHGPNTKYKVNVTARDDVPFFGPPLPNPPIFTKGSDLHDFLITKLINAESACYKAEKFSRLEMRTRASLLGSLVDEVRRKSVEFLGSAFTQMDSMGNGSTGGSAGSRFMETVRKALSSAKSASANNKGSTGESNGFNNSSSSASSTPAASTILTNGHGLHHHGSIGGGNGTTSGNSTNGTNSNNSSMKLRHSHHSSVTGSPVVDVSSSSSTLQSYRNGAETTVITSVNGLAKRPPSPASPDTPPHISASIRVSESDDSSLNSEELEGSAASHHHHHFHHKASCGKPFKSSNEDSDTGLESMSSAGTPNKRSCSLCLEDESNARTNDGLRGEINKLKCDKLDLLRQNVSCQRDIKKLKERELQLQSDLQTASKEILRLRNLLKEYGSEGSIV